MEMVWSITKKALANDTKYVVNILNEDYMFQVNGLNYNSVKMKIRFIWQRILWEKQQKRTVPKH